MNKVNQILLIKKFFLSNEKQSLINQVNDELDFFYI